MDYNGTIIKGKITKSFILSFYQQILIFFILLTGLHSTWRLFWFKTIERVGAPVFIKSQLKTNDTHNLLIRTGVSPISILDEYFYPDKGVFLERFGKDSEGNSYNLFDEGHYNYGEIKRENFIRLRVYGTNILVQLIKDFDKLKNTAVYYNKKIEIIPYI